MPHLIEEIKGLLLTPIYCIYFIREIFDRGSRTGFLVFCCEVEGE